VGVRNSLNRYPVVAAGGTLLIILAAAWFVYNQVGGSNAGGVSKAYYTTDETDFSVNNLFVDHIGYHPPFMHNGKEAFLAHVYTCDGGKTRFIGYIEKFDDDSKARLDAAPHDANGRITDASSLSAHAEHGVIRLAKKKGGVWVQSNDEEPYAKVIAVTCDEGATGALQEVFPK
jgi:hypothetical protein